MCIRDRGKTILVFAAAILAYTVPSMIGGNGYLSVYLCGIILGNSYLPHNLDMVLFFDGLTEMCRRDSLFYCLPEKKSAGSYHDPFG